MYTGNKPLVVICFLLAIAFTIPACGTVKAYSGPELPPDQIAIIKPKDSLHIETLDGKELEGNFWGLKQNAAIKPGPHALKLVEVSCIDFYTGTTLLTTCYNKGFVTLYFEAEAGHTYHVRGSGYIFWIEDEENGEVVAGYKPE